MSQEERRAAIVRTTLPLLVEHGGTVSTSQIAAAAGIAEGTVFRAFKDKQDLLLACMRAGMDSGEVIARIEAIDLSGPVAERLTEGIRVVSSYLDRVWSLGQALRAGGVGPEAMQRQMHGDGDDDAPREPGPPAELLRVFQVMSRLIDKTADNLRVQPERAVRMLLSFIVTNRLQSAELGQPVDDPAELVDLFLHGVVHNDDKGNHQ